MLVSPAQAVAEAIARSPVLLGAGATQQATRGDRLQAGLRPNPEVSILGENFGNFGGRRNDISGSEPPQTTFNITQRAELGGKRGARVNLADRGNTVADLDFATARLDLVRDVTVALSEVVAASRFVDLEQERSRLANETLRAVRGRVEAGKEPLLQQRRAEVARSIADLAVDKARRETEIALQNLAVLLGVARVELAPRQTWFDDVGPEPAKFVGSAPALQLSANPDVARLDAVVDQRRANLRLQRANAVPDVSFQGGVRHFESNSETAFVAGVSIPLPIFDRNQGGIARANAELTKAEVDARHIRLVVTAAFEAAEHRLATAWRAVRTLRMEVVPAAEQAASFAGEGYRAGKFGFLEVLDAQRALSDARTQLNDALREAHARRAEVDRLLGREPES